MRVAPGTALGPVLLTLSVSAACAHLHAREVSGPRRLDRVSPQARADLLRRATVWRPTRIAEMDLFRGPQGKDGFDPDQQVTCDYVTPDKPLTGHTPKFLCDLGGGDVAKVKYNSGEVYAEVAASRLLWALGFGADRDYPVQVTCRNCPIEPWFWSSERKVEEKRYQTATIQRRLDGKDIETRDDEGWAWPELDVVDERAGGASRDQRDGLKLLAVFLQHSDSKPSNQRFVCLPGGVVKDEAGHEDCKAPFLYVHDVGLTFGKATLLNNTRVDLQAWRSQPMWKDPGQCVANMKKSLSGSLADPRIGEGGRKFLADLLAQLSDAQIRDMFRAARFERLEERIRAAEGERLVTLDDWVEVFKHKRGEIVNRKCPP